MIDALSRDRLVGGIARAFTRGQSDFTGIAPDPFLHIQAAPHKGFIAVDKEGSEAAVATR